MSMRHTNFNQKDLLEMFLAQKIIGYFVVQDAKEVLIKIGCLATLKKNMGISQLISCLSILRCEF